LQCDKTPFDGVRVGTESLAGAHALDREDVRKRLQSVEASLERLAEWLTASRQRVVCLGSPRGSFTKPWTAYGWCSDRAIEGDRIHLAVTVSGGWVDADRGAGGRAENERSVNQALCRVYALTAPG
jgi:hypothetical protein